jgi:hypothetical protein
MKTIFQSLLLSLMSCAALAGPAAAQTNVAGTWQGRLEASPGTTITIHFVISAKPGGGYSAIVTSPDSGAIKNVPASSVTFADNKLTIDVSALSGGYTGTLRNGIFEGEWSQAGSKLPLSLKPFETRALSKADTDMLRGEWSGKYRNQGIEVTIILRFSAAADGALKAVMDVPEQGVKDWETKDVALDDGFFSVKVPAAGVEIKGPLKGDQIVGQWIQLGTSNPLTLKKGRYVATPSYVDLPAEAREQLKGKWSGILGPLTVNVRFESDTKGRTLAYFDSPNQKLSSIPVTDVKLAGTKLTFAVAGFGAKYTGDVAGNKLTGEWMQVGMPKPAPLVLTREM